MKQMRAVALLNHTAETSHRLALGAEVRHVAMKDEVPQIWFEEPSHPDRRTEERTFRVFADGDPIPEDYPVYVGTFFRYGDAYVGHIFEKV